MSYKQQSDIQVRQAAIGGDFVPRSDKYYF